METHSKCRLIQYLNHKFILEETRNVFSNEIYLDIKFHLRKKKHTKMKIRKKRNKNALLSKKE